jgi:hypothetical protein
MSTNAPETQERTAAPSRTRGLRPPWKPGESGNPGGVPRGKAKLQAGFVNDLAAWWEKEGAKIIPIAAAEDPVGVLRVIASLMPRDVTISARPFAEYSDDDLRAALDTIERYLAGGADPAGAGATIEGEATRELPALPEAADLPRGGEDAP